MPRNLTDLMEAAVSTAPPEPHHAADITRLAERRQRRRTTGIAGLAALAVVAAGGLGYGLTHDHATTPRAGWRSSARPDRRRERQRCRRARLPGYRLRALDGAVGAAARAAVAARLRRTPTSMRADV